MLVELISTDNAEGVRLDGAFFAPPVDAVREGPVDALLLLHGSRGNFSDPTTREMADDLRQMGYACLALNTTAHDTVWANPSDGSYRGNAFEILDSTCLDLKAGIDWLWDEGYRQIAILGHSMGAVRATYYVASQSDSRLAAIIPVSPVRLSCSHYLASKDAGVFQEIIDRAQLLESGGNGLELMDVSFPIQQLFSASSYLDKHGPQERYNLVKLAPNIEIPMFVLAGSRETHTRLKDMAQDLAAAVVNSPQVDCTIIEGGEHALANMKREASAAVFSWLAAVTPQRAGVR